MKIAMVTPVPGSAGGMGRVVEEYAERLKGRGHEVTVFAPALRAPNNRRTEEPKNTMGDNQQGSYVLTFLRSYVRFGNAAWVPGLAKVLDGFDIVHVHYPCIGSAGAVRRWKKHSKSGKLVITYHMDLIGQGVLKPLFYIYSQFVTPSLLRLADRIITASWDYLEYSTFAKIFRSHRDHITEITFGVDTETFAPRPREPALMIKLGLREDESVVLFVGKLDAAHYFKGVGTLLQIFALLRVEARNVRLLIVGDGNRKKHYGELAQHLKIADQVIFAGTVAPMDLPKYYALADVFVLPSETRSEAFGLVLLEAQASGVPVIASDLPGVRTLVLNGKTGLLVEPAKRTELILALSRMLTRPDERSAMGAVARARMLTNYRWDMVIDKLEALYRSLV